jgi:hypothetical protein
VAGGREPPALGIREVQAVLTQVLFEDAVLFPQVRDHVKLSAIHPSREGHEQNPPSDVEHPPRLLAAAATGKSRLNFRILRDRLRRKYWKHLETNENWSRFSNLLAKHRWCLVLSATVHGVPAGGDVLLMSYPHRAQ